jgi:hypothetical protein
MLYMCFSLSFPFDTNVLHTKCLNREVTSGVQVLFLGELTMTSVPAKLSRGTIPLFLLNTCPSCKCTLEHSFVPILYFKKMTPLVLFHLKQKKKIRQKPLFIYAETCAGKDI